jgi:DNA-binding CsgD family transcriptional regulator
MINQFLIQVIKANHSLIASTQNTAGTYTWISIAGENLLKNKIQQETLTHQEKKILRGESVTTMIQLGEQNHAINSIAFRIPIHDDQQQISGIFSLYIPLSILPSTQTSPLTQREIEVLSYTLRGQSARLIANILGISVKTVEYHLARIKHKFQCHSKAELIETALKQGYLLTPGIS